METNVMAKQPNGFDNGHTKKPMISHDRVVVARGEAAERKEELYKVPRFHGSI